MFLFLCGGAAQNVTGNSGHGICGTRWDSAVLNLPVRSIRIPIRRGLPAVKVAAGSDDAKRWQT